jgi:ubiquitin-activating enzyme E1-like protein 2
MSEYVYFNEPSYESTMGTPEGELFNTAYSNIVRIGNIRYAMIEAIRHPTKGFEDVILKSFYLKRDMILKEVNSWVDKANAPANYTGLV